MSDLVGPNELYQSEKVLLTIWAVAAFAVIFTGLGAVATPEMSELYLTRVGHLLLAEVGVCGITGIALVGSFIFRARQSD